MPVDESHSRELSSWKEIAAYLGVSVRTAQSWERERALPITRLPGPRGRVRVHVAELEAWKNSGRELESPPTVRRRWAGGYALTGIGILGAILAAGISWPRDRQPASIRAQGHFLVATDDDGGECWRARFGGLVQPLNAGDFKIGDFDADGKAETLVRVAAEDTGGRRILICYGQNGKERWRFVPGKEVRTGKEIFSPPFSVRQFLLLPQGKKGEFRAVVSSSHGFYFPNQVALLDQRGRVLRDYWHSGHLNTLAMTEVNRKTLIVAGGVSNGRGQATLVLLDPDEFDGASQEENPEFQLQGFQPGRERRRIFFPRSCMNLKLEPFGWIDEILQGSGELVATVQHTHKDATNAVMYYHFTSDLTFRQMVVTSSFELAHRILLDRHVLDHPLLPAEVAELKPVMFNRETLARLQP